MDIKWRPIEVPTIRLAVLLRRLRVISPLSLTEAMRRFTVELEDTI